ncbi:chromosome partition protein MukF [Vibrio variabilis]|uniref:Chromosome partition protein MukF n=1 Tax=Vibrio variabilis TaxID=990271 RepID=A0ABQ0J9X1_9VIBR|nr:chromosome partition protein MukF [Vibrio variabilis]
MSDNTLNADDRPIDELVGWVKQHDFALNLSTERLAFLISIAVLSNERFDEELGEGELHDAFKIVTGQFEQTGEATAFRANNAINELVKQRLLSRFTSEVNDGASIYRLSLLPSVSPITTSDIANSLNYDSLSSFQWWQARWQKLSRPRKKAGPLSIGARTYLAC